MHARWAAVMGMVLILVVPGLTAAGEEQPAETPGRLKELLSRDPVETLESIDGRLRGWVQRGDQAADERFGLTPKEESEWGAFLHEGIVGDATVLEDADLQSAMDALVARFVALSERKDDITYRVTILDSPGVNAFAVLGGYIYINHGLIKEFGYDADAVMFVIGHEIAHIELGHCRRKFAPLVRGAAIGGIRFGVVLGMLRNAAVAGYSQELEFEADAWSYDKMAEMGYSKQARLKGIRALHAYTLRARGEAASRSGPPANPNETLSGFLSVMERYMNSHPPTPDRIRYLESR